MNTGAADACESCVCGLGAAAAVCELCVCGVNAAVCGLGAEGVIGAMRVRASPGLRGKPIGGRVLRVFVWVGVAGFDPCPDLMALFVLLFVGVLLGSFAVLLLLVGVLVLVLLLRVFGGR